MRTARRVAVIAGIAVVALVAAALAFLLGGAAPQEVSIEDAAGASGSTTASSSDVDVEGTWTVDTEVQPYSFEDSAGTFVGFRIDEELANIGAATAVGRTPEVAGTITLQGTTLTEATIIADVGALTTDEPRRDDRARTALGVPTHDEVTFTLTEPIDLGDAPEVGEQVTVTAAGDLTVNGVTRPVEVPLEAVVSEAGVLVVTGSFEVALADHDVQAPSAPMVLGVADTATVELQLYLTQGE